MSDNKYQSKIQVIKPRQTFSNYMKSLVGLKKFRETKTYDFSNIKNAQKATEKDGKIKITVTKKK